ncbi:MAG: hypothetical protein V9F03_12645 [Microthrixaceae bacterium]
MCGRIKDVIIVGGRNVYPQDIEKAVGEVSGVRTGNVIAFGTEGRLGAQNIIVVAEARADGLDELQRNITNVVTDTDRESRQNRLCWSSPVRYQRHRRASCSVRRVVGSSRLANSPCSSPEPAKH